MSKIFLFLIFFITSFTFSQRFHSIIPQPDGSKARMHLRGDFFIYKDTTAVTPSIELRDGNAVVRGSMTVVGKIFASTVTATGKITAKKFYGDGSGLTNLLGDNLGNHIATTTLKMSGFSIINVSTIIASGGGFLSSGAVGGILAEGPGTRMMWYPAKRAFRAGEVTGVQWNNERIGEFSVAFGKDAIARGAYSFAIGNRVEALDTGSIACGYDAKSKSHFGVAIGRYALVENLADHGIALGLYARSSNFSAIAIGRNAFATGNESVAIGGGAWAEGSKAFSIGRFIMNEGERSFIIGIADEEAPYLNIIPKSFTIIVNSTIPAIFISPPINSGSPNNIGIATTTPTHRLDVNGGAIVRSSMTVTGDGLSGTMSVFNVAGSTLVVRYDGNVGIMTTTPHSRLQVIGALATAITTVTGNTTLTIDHSTVLCNASNGAFTITLPSAVGIAGRIYTIKKIDATTNAVTISPATGQNIDGATSYTLTTQWASVIIQTNGSHWFILAKK